MSDNACIYIQHKQGRFYVWKQQVDYTPEMPDDAQSFETRDAAYQHAAERAGSETPEYGIAVLKF